MKKTLRTTVAIFGAICILSLSACNKEEPNNGNTEYTPIKGQTMNPETELFLGITYSDVITNSMSHNGYLDDLLSNFNFYASDYEEELINAIKKLTFGNITADEIDRLISDTTGYADYYTDLHNDIYNSQFISNPEEVYSMIGTIDSSLLDTISYARIQVIIDSLQGEAYMNLDNFDMFFVINYTEMVRYSSYYWMSPEQGGMGDGYSILTMSLTPGTKDNKPQGSTASQAVGQAALADCATAAVGCLITAAAGAINPALAGPTLAWAAKKAAKNSAAAAIKVVVKNNLKH